MSSGVFGKPLKYSETTPEIILNKTTQIHLIQRDPFKDRESPDAALAAKFILDLESHCITVDRPLWPKILRQNRHHHPHFY